MRNSPASAAAGVPPEDRLLDTQRFTLEVAADHPAFEGHFPGHPVLPGVVLLAEVVACAQRCLGLPMDRILIKVAKFHAPVARGATLAIELVPGSDIAFTISCEGARVASGSLAPARDAAPPHAGGAVRGVAGSATGAAGGGVQ